MTKQSTLARCGWAAAGAAIALLFAACSSAPPISPSSEVQSASGQGAGEARSRSVPVPPAASPDPAAAVPARAGRAGAATPPPAEAERESMLSGFGRSLESEEGATEETIVVTGTRVRRDDYSAPSATTVVTAEDLRDLGVISVADMVEQLPNNVQGDGESPAATDSAFNMGADIANLRGLNPNAGARTLTMADQRRMAPPEGAASTDLNMIPSALIGGMRAVTGGASATYGADAMAGAVNVILDGQAPLTRVSPGEEVWIISQAALEDPNLPVAEDALGPGVMIARVVGAIVDDIGVPTQPQPVREIPLPLRHTSVEAKVQGYVGTVDVTQEFENPYDEKIEAVYMFPLPEKAAVSEFVMTIGERRIRGILREKEEAQEIYRQARAQGLRASLLTQHRPNVFEQKVANIEPGKQIDVNIRYYQTLAYGDGWYSFVFPTVVGPRYNPSYNPDPLLSLPQTHAPTPEAAVHYLTPQQTSAHDFSISVELDAGVEIEEIVSSHALTQTQLEKDIVKIELADGVALPNQDFRLDFRVAGEQIKSSLLTYVDPESDRGYFTMMLYPPADLEQLDRQPLELVFVLDCSGSMNGAPIAQAKDAIIAALDRLGPDDTFQIIRFSQSASQFGPRPLPATDENIRAAREYVRTLQGSGGTEMIQGIRSALDFPHDDERLRFVTFLTDGFIGNEAQILDAIDARLGASRIFSFGVGSSPNRYLLERMASTGRGAVAYLSLRDSGRVVMDAFFDRIAHPAMIDVEIDWGQMQVADVYPSRLPDLFVGRPVIVTGRFEGSPGALRMTGRAAGEKVRVKVDRERNAPEHDFLPNLWARLRIAELNDRLAVEPASASLLGSQIRDTALAYNLMSDYTSFIAVDASEVTAGGRGTTVIQAVPVPDGVRYETSIGR